MSHTTPAHARSHDVRPNRSARLGAPLASFIALAALAACASGGSMRGGGGGDPHGIAALRQAVDSMVADPSFRSMQWGILIVDADLGDTLYAHNAGKLFMPASNQKIVTGAVALHLLGSDYRFATTVGTTGAIAGDVISGDLVIAGTGDPSVSDRMAGDAMAPLRTIADSLASRGVRRVTGALVRGGDHFPDATLGFGWAWDDLDFAYSAGVDELFFNDGVSRVVVRAGAVPGDTVAWHTTPARTFPRVGSVARTGVAGTTSRRGPNALRIRQDSADMGAVLVEGELAVGDTAVLTITHRDQNLAYLLALREALLERGILVDGGVAARAPVPMTYPLFTLQSPPLREILPAFEKPSQNQIGEILLKTLGRVRTGVGSADSGAAVVRSQLLAWGAPADGFVVRDGSGLSRHDVVTPETLVKVLAAIRTDTAFAAFYDALPVAGVDGTIRSRMLGTPAQGNVRAKTGTLDMVRALSGYVTTADGRLLLFSILANNWTVPVRDIEIVQDAIAVRLAQLRAGGRR